MLTKKKVLEVLNEELERDRFEHQWCMEQAKKSLEAHDEETCDFYIQMAAYHAERINVVTTIQNKLGLGI